MDVRSRNRLVDNSGSTPLRSHERMCRKNHSSRPAASAAKTTTSRLFVPICRIAITRKNMPVAESTPPAASNFRLLSGGSGSVIPRQSTTIRATTAACSRNVAAADRRGDEAADQRPRRRADAAHAADDPEGPRARLQIIEEDRRQDVDRRDHQGRPNALQGRVSEDQHPKHRGERRHHGARAIHREPPDQAALAPENVRQLAARDHQRRHAQKKQCDRGLHAMHGRFEISGDAGDRDVHARTREARDKLR